MSIPTLLVGKEELAGTQVEVSGHPYRHLFRARRLKVGDPLVLVDGFGEARAATVAAVDKARGLLELGERFPARPRGSRIELWVAGLKPERASWLVEKATELGVSGIVFFTSERTQHQPSERLVSRLHRVASSALEQSGGRFLPRIDVGPTLQQLLDGQEHSSSGPDHHGESNVATVVLHTAPIPSRAPRADPGAEIRLLVGPEGGFSPSEAERIAERCDANRTRRAWSSMYLGEAVLRVETAAIVGCSLMLHGQHALDADRPPPEAARS